MSTQTGAGMQDLTVAGRYGTAVLSAGAPPQVRLRVLEALGGPRPADAAPEPAPGETGAWADPDHAPRSVPLPETGVWVDTADEADEAAPHAQGDQEDEEQPEPGAGSGRRRRGRRVDSADVPALAPASADTADAAASPDSGGDATQTLGEATIALVTEATPPLVRAVMCAAGHPNPPDAAACQACAAPLTGEIRQVPRPVLAVLTLSTGQAVPVRGDVVVGRAPQAPAGSETSTQLLTVPSPAHFVSRSHLEVSVAGWSLLARDLGSANGTVLVRAGMPPVLLASALPTPLIVGDLLDVGDGVTLRVDPPL
ncbi:MAG: FHA domain-containing protein [Actinomyces succiniciruminis]|nr:FHA domain-containing protein [Actinomyces succiniciruminis]